MARALLLLTVCLAARADVADDLVTAARSPYELSRFVETHTDFDWAPLWKALGIEDANVWLPACEDNGRGIAPCSTELITVVEPFQVVLVLKHESSPLQAFLRYRQAGADQWQFGGAYEPYVKYFTPEHRIVRSGDIPFLTVTGQGTAGTGLFSKIERWIDLTSDNFTPVFSYTPEGNYSPPDGIGRTVHGFVVSLKRSPTERITVSYQVEFQAYEDLEGTQIGQRSDEAVYVRPANGEFVFDPKLSSTSAKDIETFYEDLLSDYTDTEFLKFNFDGLKEVVTGDDDKAREWLWGFLECCPDSTEAKQLKALAQARTR